MTTTTAAAAAATTKSSKHSKKRKKKFVFTEKKNALGCFDSILCQICTSQIPTNHRCEMCGKAFCVMCTEKWGTSGIRNRCGEHVDEQGAEYEEVVAESHRDESDDEQAATTEDDHDHDHEKQRKKLNDRNATERGRKEDERDSKSVKK